MSALPHPNPLSQASYSAAELSLENDAVILLDQRKLPAVEEYLSARDAESVIQAIRTMVVRGAPAIGIAAAYGLTVGSRGLRDRAQLLELAERIASARPTAVNLRWAIARCLRAVEHAPAELWSEILAGEARAIHREDVAACQAMGALGAAYIPDGATVLTHCNAGALATGGYGTALGVVRAAIASGKRVRVLADETRPLLQGARLTAWELDRDNIPVTVIADSSVAWLMANQEVTAIVVGADRIAANGDVANKIGTYQVATVAAAHGVPFYVAAPWSTVDVTCPSGSQIPIEERSTQEISHYADRPLTPNAVDIRNPAFDVTPARLVRSIFCERGVISPPLSAGILALQTLQAGEGKQAGIQSRGAADAT